MNKTEVCVSEKSKEIMHVFNNLAVQIDKCTGLVRELTDSLTPILTPETEVNCSENVNKGSDLSAPFAQDLDSQLDRIKKLNRFLSDLIERVQI